MNSAQDIARLSNLILFNSMDLLQAPKTWSGVEMALSDLLGKMLETPVWRLLGFDRAHPKGAYASTLFRQTPQETFYLAQDLRNQGSMAAKLAGAGSAPPLPPVSLVSVRRADHLDSHATIAPHPILLTTYQLVGMLRLRRTQCPNMPPKRMREPNYWTLP